MGLSTGQVLSLVVAAGGVQQSVQARSEAKKASNLQARRSELQRQRQIRQQIRQARAQRAQILNVAAQTGVAGSSAEAGALGSIATQRASNVGFIQQTGDLSQGIAAASQSSANAAGISSNLFKLSGLALQAESLFNRPKQNQNIFNGNS